MKKAVIILGIVIGIIIVLFIIKSLNTTKENDTEYLNKYLKENNYKKEDNLYVKVITDDDEIKDVTNLDEYDKEVTNKKSVEYTTLSLDTDTFKFKRDNRTYSDDIEKIYNGSVELKGNKVVEFDYLINIFTSQIMIEGSYDMNKEYGDDNYKCNLYYQSDLEEDEEELKNIYCLLAKVETLDFIGNINELKNDKKIYTIINE